MHSQVLLTVAHTTYITNPSICGPC